MANTTPSPSFRKILGISFFNGGATQAAGLLQDGGLLVVPAAPALKNLPWDAEYREALLGADVVITDSALMVMLWNLLERDSLRRLSGLEYMRALLQHEGFRRPGESFWIMASPASADKNISWLREQGLEVAKENYYLAPLYRRPIEDPELVARLRDRKPRHVVITLGGGTQELLGLCLKRNLGYPAAIHCIGAAIAFLSGDQVRIPEWADRFYLGWLFRCLDDPRRYGPRYWDAFHLMPLLAKYRDRLPDIAPQLSSQDAGT